MLSTVPASGETEGFSCTYTIPERESAMQGDETPEQFIHDYRDSNEPAWVQMSRTQFREAVESWSLSKQDLIEMRRQLDKFAKALGLT